MACIFAALPEPLVDRRKGPADWALPFDIEKFAFEIVAKTKLKSEKTQEVDYGPETW